MRPYPDSLGVALKDIAKEQSGILKRRRTIGRLTDPHHVSKLMKRELFYNLKNEVVR